MGIAPRQSLVGVAVAAAASIALSFAAATCVAAQAPAPAADSPAPATAPAAAVTVAGVKAQIAKLKQKLNAATPAGSTPTERTRSRDELSRLFNLTNSVPELIDDGQFEQAARVVHDAVRMTQDENHRKDLTALSESVAALQISERAGMADRVRALLRSLPDRVRQAKSRADIEPVIAEVSAAVRRLNQGGMRQELQNLTADDTYQQLHQAESTLRRYGDMLAADAEGDVDTAWQIGAQLLQQDQINGAGGRGLPGRDAIRQRVEALDRRREEAARKQLDEMAAAARRAKSSADVAPLQDKLQAMVDQQQRRSVIENTYQRFATELQALQVWGRVLDLESKQKYRSALAALGEWRQRGQGDRRPSPTVVTEDMLAQKSADLQRALLERGDEITDPALRPLADGLTKATTLDELQKAARAVDAVVGPNQGVVYAGDADTQPAVHELITAAAQVRALVDLRGAIATREWGRFWQLNQAAARAGNPMYGNQQPRHRWSAKLDELRLALVRQAVEQSAELKELNVKLAADVPLDRAMFDAADAAIAAEDYRRAVMILQAYLSFAYTPDARPSEQLRADLKGLDLFAQARSFEAAGDLAPAVARYRAVLQLTGPRVPVQKATERLTVIGKSNPDVLKQPAAAPDAPPDPQVPGQGQPIRTRP